MVQQNFLPKNLYRLKYFGGLSTKQARIITMMSGQSQPCPLAKKDPCCLWTVASNPSCSAEQPCWDKVMRNLHLLDGWCGQMTDQGAPVLQGLGVVMHGVGGGGAWDGGGGEGWGRGLCMVRDLCTHVLLSLLVKKKSSIFASQCSLNPEHESQSFGGN